VPRSTKCVVSGGVGFGKGGKPNDHEGGKTLEAQERINNNSTYMQSKCV
jgi:hypothetical protein